MCKGKTNARGLLIWRGGACFRNVLCRHRRTKPEIYPGEYERLDSRGKEWWFDVSTATELTPSGEKEV
jgi:hypothetical protein